MSKTACLFSCDPDTLILDLPNGQADRDPERNRRQQRRPTDAYLPIDTPLDRPDGHYIAIGMDVEGPFSQDEAHEIT
jgi:hypothetical protein